MAVESPQFLDWLSGPSVVAGVVRRPAEMRAVDDFLASAATGPSALLIEGEPGIGKSTVWLAALARARGRGFQVVSARAGQAESVLAYAPLADLLGGVDEAVLAGLPEPQRVAVDRVLVRGHAGGPGSDRHAVSAALLSVVEKLASNAPVIVAIDDLQWLDPSSLRALLFAARRFSAPVGVLATVRTDPESARVGAQLQLSTPDAVERLRVAPLSLGGVFALVADRLKQTFTRPTLLRIYQTSGGNPFYALELARAVRDGSVTAGPSHADLPGTLAELVRAHIERLDTAVRDALLAAACTMAPTVELIAHATRTEVDQAAEALETAEAHDIVAIDGNRVFFAHPLLAFGVYRAGIAAKRRAMHRRLAEVVEESELAARHLALGATSGNPAIWQSLDDAAVSARRRGAPAAAAELLELAMRLGGATPQRRIRLAGYLFQAGEALRARTLLEAALDDPATGPERIRALRLLAEVRAVDDSFGEAAELLKQALAETDPKSAMGVLLLVTVSFAQSNSGEYAAALTTAEEAANAAAQLGYPPLLSQALAVRTVLRFHRGHGFDQPSLHRALEFDDATIPLALRPKMCDAALAAWTGRLDHAREQMTRLRQDCVDYGRESDLVFIAFHRVLLEVWRGDYAQAALIAEDAGQRASQLGGDFPLFVARTTQAALSAYAGRVDDARRDATEALAATRRFGSTAIDVWPIALLVFVEVSVGNPQAALTMAEPVLSRVSADLDATEINIAPFLPDTIEALIQLERGREAEPLIAALERNAQRLDRPWMAALGARTRAMLHAANGDVDAAITTTHRAIAEHSRLPMPFELARTQLLLGQLQRRARQKKASAATLHDALRRFEELHTPQWADRARSELERTQSSRNQTTKLTAAEQRVAELAASGMSNREIATTLFISPKTVEVNLTRAYRKLGIRSRAQLGSRLNGPPQPA